MRSRLAGGLAVAVLIPALLAGCGENQEKPGAEKERYIQQSDPICRQTFDAAASAGTGRDKATAERLADVWRDGADKLKALPVPAESEEQARQFVTDVENISLSYTAAARALDLNDSAKADRAFGDVEMIKRRAADTADEYGYDVCNQING